VKSYVLDVDTYYQLPETERREWDEWVRSLGVDPGDVFRVRVGVGDNEVSVDLHRHYRGPTGALEYDAATDSAKLVPVHTVYVKVLPPFVAEKLAV
jgi:hypothetical protein